MISEQQAMIRDAAKSFAEKELLSNSARWDRANDPSEEVKAVCRKMGSVGLMGVVVDPKWGGAGADLMAYVLALEEIAAGDAGVSTIMSCNVSPCCTTIQNHGTDYQKKKFLRPMATGEVVGAFALTEPHTGSDAANIRTRAERKNGKWVLNGAKQLITSAAISGIVTVYAVTDPSSGKHGISAFIVPKGTKGFSVGRLESKMGQRSSDTGQLLFDNVELSDDHLLGHEGQGLALALGNLEVGRIGIAAQSVGMARAAYKAALSYAVERQAFGKKIIEHQAIAFKLADMATDIEAARQLTWHAARLKDAGLPCMKEASMAKLFASEAAERVASAAIQIHGGYGYMKDFPVERIFRDCKATQIYEGTSDVQRLVISRNLAA